MHSTADIVFGARCHNCIGANCYNCNNAWAARTDGSAIIFYGTALFEQLTNIERFIEMRMVVRVCMSGYVYVSFSHEEVALHINCHSLFHSPVNNLYSIHN